MPIRSEELIDALEHEAVFRRETLASKKRDAQWVEDAEAAIKALKANPSDPAARRRARDVMKRCQNNPLKGRKLD